MKRIRSDGCSKLLRVVADRVKSSVSRDSRSLNVAPFTVIGKPILKKASIGSMDELIRLDRAIEVIDVKSNGCNEAELKEFDLSRFVNLRELNVGEKCFENVKVVKLIGLKKLERVVIGKDSFKNFDREKKYQFYLKDCERLKELRMGDDSFRNYSVCVIENVPSLEVIEMQGVQFGDINIPCSLELKSML